MKILIILRIVQAGLGFILLRVMIEMLSKQAVSEISIIQSAVNLCALIFLFPIGSYLNINLVSWRRHKQLVRNIIIFVAYMAIIGVIFLGIMNATIKLGSVEILSEANLLSVTAAIYLFSTSANAFISGSANIVNERKLGAILATATIMLNIGISVLLIVNYTSNASVWLIGAVIANTLCACTGLLLLHKMESKSTLDITDANNQKLIENKSIIIKQYILPTLLIALLSWLNSDSARMIYIFMRKEELINFAVFTAGVTLSVNLSSILESLLITTYQSKLYQAIESDIDGKKHWIAYADVIVTNSVFLMVALIALSTEVVSVMLPSDYRGAARYFLLGVIVEHTRIVLNCYKMYSQVIRKSNWIVVPYLLGTLLGLIATIMLAIVIGMDGLLVGQLIGGIFMIYLCSKKIRHNFINIYIRKKNIAFIMCAIILAVIQSIIEDGYDVVISMAKITIIGGIFLALFISQNKTEFGKKI